MYVDTIDLKDLLLKQTTVDTSSLTITEDLELESDLELDFLDIVEICIVIDEKHNILIPNEEIEKFKTVKDMVDSIKSKYMKKNPNIDEIWFGF